MTRDPIGFKRGLNLYQYATNPIHQTDPLGLTIIINGALIFKVLKSRPEGKALENSTNVHTIMEANGGNSTGSETSWTDARNGVGCGSIILFNSSKATESIDANSAAQRPPFVGLPHERGHALDIDQGIDSLDMGIPTPSRTSHGEADSISAENKVRGNMVFLIVLIIINLAFYPITTFSMRDNVGLATSWNVNSELEYYQELRSTQPLEYSVVPAYLNAALNNKKYYAHLMDVQKIIHTASSWVLIQKINIESNSYLIYFIDLSLDKKDDISIIAGCIDSNDFFNEIKNTPLDKSAINELIFNEDQNNNIDLSSYVKDGTMVYITASKKNDLRRMAIYNPSISPDGKNKLALLLEMVEKNLSKFK